MLASIVSLQQGKVRASEKSMKIVNIEGENLHVFWTIWGMSMKYSGKTWLMIILKVTKKQSLTLFLSRKHTFWKNHRVWPKLTPSLFKVKKIIIWSMKYNFQRIMFWENFSLVNICFRYLCQLLTDLNNLINLIFRLKAYVSFLIAKKILFRNFWIVLCTQVC